MLSIIMLALMGFEARGQQINGFINLPSKTSNNSKSLFQTNDASFLDAAEKSLLESLKRNKYDTKSYWDLASLYYYTDYDLEAENMFNKIYQSPLFNNKLRRTALEINKEINNMRNNSLLIDSVNIQIDEFGNAVVEEINRIRLTQNLSGYYSLCVPYKKDYIKNINVKSTDLQMKGLTLTNKWKNRTILSVEFDAIIKTEQKEYYNFTIVYNVINFARIIDSLADVRVVGVGYPSECCPGYILVVKVPHNSYISHIDPTGFSRTGNIVAWNSPWHNVNDNILGIHYKTPGFSFIYVLEKGLLINYFTKTSMIYIILVLSFLYYYGVNKRNRYASLILYLISIVYSMYLFNNYSKYISHILSNIISQMASIISLNDMIFPFMLIFVNLILLIAEVIKWRFIKDLSENDEKESLFIFITLVEACLIYNLLWSFKTLLLDYIGNYTGKFHVIFWGCILTSLIMALLRYKIVSQVSLWWLLGGIFIGWAVFSFFDTLIPEFSGEVKICFGIISLSVLTLLFLFLNIPRINTYLKIYNYKIFKLRFILTFIEAYMPQFWVCKKGEEIRRISTYFFSITSITMGILFLNPIVAMLFVVSFMFFRASIWSMLIKPFLVGYIKRFE